MSPIPRRPTRPAGPVAHLLGLATLAALILLVGGATVVSAETPASHKRKPRRSQYVPDVCAALGIPCITNLGMMRREGWRL